MRVSTILVRASEGRVAKNCAFSSDRPPFSSESTTKYSDGRYFVQISSTNAFKVNQSLRS